MCNRHITSAVAVQREVKWKAFPILKEDYLQLKDKFAASDVHMGHDGGTVSRFNGKEVLTYRNLRIAGAEKAVESARQELLSHNFVLNRFVCRNVVVGKNGVDSLMRIISQYHCEVKASAPVIRTVLGFKTGKVTIEELTVIGRPHDVALASQWILGRAI